MGDDVYCSSNNKAEVAVRVLVVEDEPDLQDAIVRSLREDGYAVDPAATGDDGMFKATNWEYDAIVLDLMLPGKDGWQVLAELRKTKSTPVLILTARDAVADRVRGLDSGADDYLLKPFAVKELLARLRALIRRSAGKASPQILFGDFVVDSAARIVTKSGEPVALTASEYALVELLAMHRGELVTRTMIYDHLYDENDDTLSNLTDVHVSNVRKKLGKDVIVTRRGLGYIIE
jgi:two-component system OmpR family response regulator